jgi:primosomal replication protein N
VTAFSGSLTHAKGGAVVDAKSGSVVVAEGRTQTIASSGSLVIAHRGAEVLARAGSHVLAQDGAQVKAESGAIVSAQRNALIAAESGAKVTRQGFISYHLSEVLVNNRRVHSGPNGWDGFESSWLQETSKLLSSNSAVGNIESQRTIGQFLHSDGLFRFRRTGLDSCLFTRTPNNYCGD